MERLSFVFFRLIFLILFVLGFIGAAASGSDHDENGKQTDSPVLSLFRDVRLAEEVNALNEGRWNQDVTDLKQDGLARVENLLEDVEAPPSEPPNSPQEYTLRAKSELAE